MIVNGYQDFLVSVDEIIGKMCFWSVYLLKIVRERTLTAAFCKNLFAEVCDKHLHATVHDGAAFTVFQVAFRPSFLLLEFLVSVLHKRLRKTKENKTMKRAGQAIGIICW